ncbi:MAG: hypothetical protein ACPIOQ_17175 [Promethearchaeia archaeon]
MPWYGADGKQKMGQAHVRQTVLRNARNTPASTVPARGVALSSGCTRAVILARGPAAAQPPGPVCKALGTFLLVILRE